MEKKFITTNQAAELAGVTTMTILNLCKSGVLRYAMRSHLYCPLLEDVEKYKARIQQVHEAETQIEIYHKKLKEESDRLKREVLRLREENDFQLSNMEMYPRRIAALTQVLESIIDCFSHYTDYKDTGLTARDIEILQKVMKGIPLAQIGAESSPYPLHPESIRVAYVQVLHKIASGRSALRHLINENKELRRELQTRCEEVAALKNKKKKEESYVLVFNDETKRISKILSRKVEELELSARALNCLHTAGIKTVRDIVNFHRADLLKFRNFGKKSLSEIDDILYYSGLRFGMDVTKYPEYIDLNE